MPEYLSGRHSTLDAAKKNSPTGDQKPFINNLTRRNVSLTESMFPSI